jgi:hypothetical protein
LPTIRPNSAARGRCTPADLVNQIALTQRLRVLRKLRLGSIDPDRANRESAPFLSFRSLARVHESVGIDPLDCCSRIGFAGRKGRCGNRCKAPTDRELRRESGRSPARASPPLAQIRSRQRCGTTTRHCGRASPRRLRTPMEVSSATVRDSHGWLQRDRDGLWPKGCTTAGKKGFMMSG